MSSNPIGIFDSGVGGVSIWNEIHQLLPMESTLYLSDSKNAPYGPIGENAIIDLSIKNKFLIKIKSQQDKRKYNLKPSAQTLKEFEDWAKGFSGF